MDGGRCTKILGPLEGRLGTWRSWIRLRASREDANTSVLRAWNAARALQRARVVKRTRVVSERQHPNSWNSLQWGTPVEALMWPRKVNLQTYFPIGLLSAPWGAHLERFPGDQRAQHVGRSSAQRPFFLKCSLGAFNQMSGDPLDRKKRERFSLAYRKSRLQLALKEGLLLFFDGILTGAHGALWALWALRGSSTWACAPEIGELPTTLLPCCTWVFKKRIGPT